MAHTLLPTTHEPSGQRERADDVSAARDIYRLFIRRIASTNAMTRPSLSMSILANWSRSRTDFTGRLLRLATRGGDT